jgi:hypothetical protein
MLSMLALVWLPVLAGVTILIAMRDPVVSDLPLKYWSAFTCAVLMVECAGIREAAISRRLLLLLGFLWAFGYGTRWLFEDAPVAGTFLAAACWVTAAAVILRTWETTPLAFPDAAFESSPGVIPGEVFTQRRGSPLRTIFRVQGFMPLAPFLLVLLQGTSGPVLYVFLAFGWVRFRTQFRWLSALPVQPRSLLGIAMAPTALAVAAGYLLSVYLPPFPNGHERGVSVRARQEPVVWPRSGDTPGCTTMNVLPSLEFWVPARSGKAPLLQAPWGETFQPSTYRISGVDAYNPYAVGCNNSERFLDWQFRRATIAAYGRPLGRDKNDRSYMVDWHPVVTGSRTRFVNLAFLCGFLMLSTLIAMLADWQRFQWLPRWVWFASGPLIGVFAGGVVLLNMNVVQWISWTLPDNLAAAIAVSMVPLVLLYLAIDKLFRQLEIAGKPEIPRG